MGEHLHCRYVLFCAAFIYQILTVGLPISLSVMYAELIVVFQAERWKVSLIQGLFLGLTIGAGVLWTMLIQKIGIGSTMVVGTMLGAIGLFASAFSPSVLIIIVLTGIITGIGLSACYLLSYMVVNKAFGNNPHVQLTMLSIGSSLGQIVMPLFVELLIQKYCWSGTFILMSGIVIQCLPCSVLIYVLLPIESTTSTDSSTERHFVCDVILRRNIPFWFLFINLLLFPIAGLVEQIFMVDQLQSIGHQRQEGSLIVILIGCANFIGRIYGSFIKANCSKHPTIYHWVYLYIIMGVCHITLLHVLHMYTLVAVLCVIEGAAFGTVFSLLSTITLETVGKERYPAALAIVNVMVGFGLLGNNILGGVVRDILGSYNLQYYFALGACVLSTVFNTVISIYATTKLKKEDENCLINGNSVITYSSLK